MAIRLVTGASGFLGREYVGNILQKTDDKVYALSRSSSSTETLQSLFEDYKDRFNIMEGNIEHSGVFTYSCDAERMAREVEVVDHFAADVSFRKSLEALRATNVYGLENFLRKINGFRNLDRVNIVFTAYINNPTILNRSVKEGEFFERGEGDFDGRSYERSKYESYGTFLKFVGNGELNRVKKRAIAPGIIIGHSANGNSGGLNMTMNSYLYSITDQIIKGHFNGDKRRFLDAWENERNELNLRLTGRNEAVKRFICVDEVANRILAIDGVDSAERSFYHIVGEPISGYNVGQTLGAVLPFADISFVEELKNPEPTELESSVKEATVAFERYRFNDDLFDTEKADSALQEAGYKKNLMTPSKFTTVIYRFFENEVIPRIKRKVRSS
jgi:nucleoside-diphosphate-sugar epimerase